MSSDGTTYNQTHTSTFTVPSSGIVTCTSLRMRIASDFALYAPPPEPCSHLLYGQTEDFIVKIKEASSLVPSVSISATGNGTCAGGTIGFTATPINGGTNPTYQWRLNGKDVGTNSNTYSSPTFVSGDLVSCVMTSSEAGICTPTVSSNSISVYIYPVTTPTVTITPDITGPICPGTIVTFSASWTNTSGSLASFTWKINGVRATSLPRGCLYWIALGILRPTN